MRSIQIFYEPTTAQRNASMSYMKHSDETEDEYSERVLSEAVAWNDIIELMHFLIKLDLVCPKETIMDCLSYKFSDYVSRLRR